MAVDEIMIGVDRHTRIDGGEPEGASIGDACSQCRKTSIRSAEKHLSGVSHTDCSSHTGWVSGGFRFENVPLASTMPLPVVLYIPNLLCYARILFSFVGLHFSPTNPRLAVGIWILSASLDLIDGIVARALNQTSSLGILLDITADNILRTTMWIAASADDPSHRFVACVVISLEWITMVSTQLQTQSGSHWKASREADPWIIKKIFAHNFRTPIGTWCIYGLFCSALFAYGSHHEELVELIPLFNIWKYIAYSGRILSMLVEGWLVIGYLGLVIERDEESAARNKTK
jgi:phosphatidylglycerophosphate synthase